MFMCWMNLSVQVNLAGVCGGEMAMVCLLRERQLCSGILLAEGVAWQSEAWVLVPLPELLSNSQASLGLQFSQLKNKNS